MPLAFAYRLKRKSTLLTGRLVQVRVRDSGIGIPPELTGRVFERFFRVDKSRSSASGGVGLGLAICKAIVDAHRGTIFVTSELGAGSTFVVTLPKSHSRAPFSVPTA